MIEFSNLLSQTHAAGFLANSAHCELVGVATTLYTTVQEVQTPASPTGFRFPQSIQTNATIVSTLVHPFPFTLQYLSTIPGYGLGNWRRC
jgi:hypothetical protein